MSRDLRYFTSTDPPPLSKEQERKTLAEQVDEYLAKGGTITEIPAGEGAERHYPIKRSRKAQINFIRNRDYSRRKE